MDSPSRISRKKVLALILGLLVVAVVAAYAVVSSGILEEKIDAEIKIETQIEDNNLVYCWYDIPLEKYSGTLQANFDDDFQLGYLLWRADNASGKELKQYAEKTYGKSDTVTNDSILYQKEVGNWNVLVSEEGTISWQDARYSVE